MCPLPSFFLFSLRYINPPPGRERARSRLGGVKHTDLIVRLSIELGALFRVLGQNKNIFALFQIMMIDAEIKGLGCRFDDHMVFGVNGTLNSGPRESGSFEDT